MLIGMQCASSVLFLLLRLFAVCGFTELLLPPVLGGIEHDPNLVHTHGARRCLDMLQ